MTHVKRNIYPDFCGDYLLFVTTTFLNLLYFTWLRQGGRHVLLSAGGGGYGFSFICFMY
jgi:hypothetical protein